MVEWDASAVDWMKSRRLLKVAGGSHRLVVNFTMNSLEKISLPLHEESVDVDGAATSPLLSPPPVVFGAAGGMCGTFSLILNPNLAY
jgi:hypothetical protein